MICPIGGGVSNGPTSQMAVVGHGVGVHVGCPPSAVTSMIDGDGVIDAVGDGPGVAVLVALAVGPAIAVCVPVGVLVARVAVCDAAEAIVRCWASSVASI